MSDVQQMELEAIRRELDRLGQRVQALEAGDERAAGDDIPKLLERMLSEEMEKKAKSTGIGILRGTILKNSGGTGIGVGRTFFTDASDLPSEEQFRERAATWGLDLLVLRTVRHLAERHLTGAPIRVMQAELAAALGVEAAALHRALTPLIAREWLRWARTVNGEEYYECQDWGATLALLVIGS